MGSTELRRRSSRPHGSGLDVERLVELHAPAGATTHPFHGPCEEIWVARERVE
jgi:hypothetical protein